MQQNKSMKLRLAPGDILQKVVRVNECFKCMQKTTLYWFPHLKVGRIPKQQNGLTVRDR